MPATLTIPQKNATTGGILLAAEILISKLEATAKVARAEYPKANLPADDVLILEAVDALLDVAVAVAESRRKLARGANRLTEDRRYSIVNAKADRMRARLAFLQYP